MSLGAKSNASSSSAMQTCFLRFGGNNMNFIVYYIVKFSYHIK